MFGNATSRANYGTTMGVVEDPDHLELEVLQLEEDYEYCAHCHGRGWVSNGDGIIGCFMCTHKKEQN